MKYNCVNRTPGWWWHRRENVKVRDCEEATKQTPSRFLILIDKLILQTLSDTTTDWRCVWQMENFRGGQTRIDLIYILNRVHYLSNCSGCRCVECCVPPRFDASDVWPFLRLLDWKNLLNNAIIHVIVVDVVVVVVVVAAAAVAVHKYLFYFLFQCIVHSLHVTSTIINFFSFLFFISSPSLIHTVTGVELLIEITLACTQSRWSMLHRT